MIALTIHIHVDEVQITETLVYLNNTVGKTRYTCRLDRIEGWTEHGNGTVGLHLDSGMRIHVEPVDDEDDGDRQAVLDLATGLWDELNSDRLTWRDPTNPEART